MKEKKWRAEKLRLNKDLNFHQDSVTTLRDANAHLAYEVGELRALRDHLLPQIKQKLSHGLLSKRIGSQ